MSKSRPDTAHAHPLQHADAHTTPHTDNEAHGTAASDEPVLHFTHDPDTGLPWPDPTVPEPDFITLAGYLFDAVAEATDGCLVAPDLLCRHGHPSWLLRLGVI